jgi:drug/metabolite transporter (DMT)-like permease
MELAQRKLDIEPPRASLRSGEALGVLAAILSSASGGINTAATRYVMGATDAVTFVALRFGLGFLLLLPIAIALNCRWPKGRDWIGAALLGILFFAVFQGIFNFALEYTSAARGALALSTLPLMTMLVAAALRAEPLTKRKTAGVLIAIGGVATALVTGLGDAPAGAWRGDGIMAAGTLCFALYNVWSRPFIARSSALGFVTAGMGAGSLVAALVSLAGGGFASAGDFGTGQWTAVIYAGTVGAALTFFLWVYGLAHTTPTKVTNTITLNPVTAAIVAAFLVDEPVGPHLLIGIAAVFTGILIASTDSLRLRRWLDLFRLWRERAAERRCLADLNDHYLKDIGLTRSDTMRDSELHWRR